MLTGDNSLLGNAQKTGPANNIGAAKDEVGLAYNTAMQEYYEEKYAKGNNVDFASKFNTAMSPFIAEGADTSNSKNHGCKVEYNESDGTITITNGGYKVIGHVDTTDGSAGISWEEMKETTVTDKETEPKSNTGSINTTENYTGYYADTDGNPNTVEGIIFADLAHDGSGQWSDDEGNYSYSAVTSGLKEYYISKESYTDTKTGYETTGVISANESYTDTEAGYGTTGVISAKEGTSGADRFYVMSLSDFDNSEHYWYYSAYSKKMSDYSTYTSTAFGKGKENTQKMITKWNDAGYGDQNDNDMWKLIQDKYSEGWFVPSSGEWSAFAVMLQGKGLTDSNYSSDFGLKGSWYWSSSQNNIYYAWIAYFNYGYMNKNSVRSTFSVRLASTF